MIAELPVGIADPVERLASMSQQMNELKASDQADTTGALTVLTGLAPPSVLAAGVKLAAAAGRQFPQRTITTVTTNVPGPQQPLYAVGRQMIAYLPFVPLSQGVRLGVAILSYDGDMTFGVTGDYDTVPEPEQFCRSIESGIGELRKAARRSARNGSEAVGQLMTIGPIASERLVSSNIVIVRPRSTPVVRRATIAAGHRKW